MIKVYLKIILYLLLFIVLNPITISTRGRNSNSRKKSFIEKKPVKKTKCNSQKRNNSPKKKKVKKTGIKKPIPWK